MSRTQLARIGGVLLLGIAIFGLSNHRGSAHVDPDDRKLEAFIEAADAVDGVMASWQQKIAHAESDQAIELRRQANDLIRQTVEQIEGISWREYRELRQEIVTDPEVLARVTEIMRQR